MDCKFFTKDGNNKSIMNNTSSSGIGFIGVLAIVFIVLKLIHVINWSWLWVLSPLWISVLAFFIILLAIIIGIFLFKR